MKRNELSVWIILITASVAGSLVAAVIPDQDPQTSKKHAEHETEPASDESYTWGTTRTVQSDLVATRDDVEPQS